MAKRLIKSMLVALSLVALQNFAVNQVAFGQDNAGTTQPPSSITATFNKIPDQVYVGGLFLVTVTVKDETGHPLPGAHVVISLDPKYVGHFRKATLRDASGDIVSELSGDTGADAKAPSWIRLSCSNIPFKARLNGSVEAPQHGSLNFQSNEFRVFSGDTYSNW